MVNMRIKIEKEAYRELSALAEKYETTAAKLARVAILKWMKAHKQAKEFRERVI